MKLLSEIERIQSVMGIIKEDEETKKQMNINLRQTVDILRYLKLYNKNRLNQKDNIASERIKEAPRLYVPDSMKTQDGVKKKITI